MLGSQGLSSVAAYHTKASLFLNTEHEGHDVPIWDGKSPEQSTGSGTIKRQKLHSSILHEETKDHKSIPVSDKGQPPNSTTTVLAAGHTAWRFEVITTTSQLITHLFAYPESYPS